MQPIRFPARSLFSISSSFLQSVSNIYNIWTKLVWRTDKCQINNIFKFMFTYIWDTTSHSQLVVPSRATKGQLHLLKGLLTVTLRVTVQKCWRMSHFSKSQFTTRCRAGTQCACWKTTNALQSLKDIQSHVSTSFVSSDCGWFVWITGNVRPLVQRKKQTAVSSHCSQTSVTALAYWPLCVCVCVCVGH